MFSEIFTLVLDTISSLYLMIILMRFILQLSRADFYNPISQFIVKATNPLLIPLRRIIPSMGGIDTASIALAILFQALVLVLKMLVVSGGVANPVFLMALSLVMVLDVLLKIYFWALIIMIVGSWVAPGSGNPALVLINQIVEPLMKPFRKMLPDMGGLDLSPILVVVLKGLQSQVLSLA
jgi:YggT family protein